MASAGMTLYWFVIGTLQNVERQGTLAAKGVKGNQFHFNPYKSTCLMWRQDSYRTAAHILFSSSSRSQLDSANNVAKRDEERKKSWRASTSREVSGDGQPLSVGCPVIRDGTHRHRRAGSAPQLPQSEYDDTSE